jgi:ADP-heptose:LPS heptosyltransferase
MGKPVPEWVGIAKGASHRHNTPERRQLHTIERQRQQLAVAGIHDLPAPDISWLTSDISHFKLPERYALIVPGGSEHRTGKRWPAHHYGTVCTLLMESGITPVLIGTKSEVAVISTIETICPDVISLLGKTSFAEIAELARHATFAIGNDTGPMHIVANTGCASLVLFSKFSNPILCAPRGQKVTILQKETLSNLAPEEVIEWIKKQPKEYGDGKRSNSPEKRTA